MTTIIEEKKQELILEFPEYPEKSFLFLHQSTIPRRQIIQLVTHPWFDRITMIVILINCILMGLYRPCEDEICVTTRCKTLEVIDHIIFAYFAVEMVLKMVAFGVFGKKAYLSDSWNRLDCFIVVSGCVQYVLAQFSGSLNLTAIRTIRVLRPLRAVNRISSLRVVVTLLLDTLPMVGNVLVLCAFVFFVFGIIAVQLWNGVLRNRCAFTLNEAERILLGPNMSDMERIYMPKDSEFICSLPDDRGIHQCSDLPPISIGKKICTGSLDEENDNHTSLMMALYGNSSLELDDSCINWNQYYNTCIVTETNPMDDAISFDNIALGWITIFVVISMEGWTDIMYFVQDSHSFWAFIYFVVLIVVGSFFMVNLFLVVISNQFAETRKRETERMMEELEQKARLSGGKIPIRFSKRCYSTWLVNQYKYSNPSWKIPLLTGFFKEDDGEGENDAAIEDFGLYEGIVRFIYRAGRSIIKKIQANNRKFNGKLEPLVGRTEYSVDRTKVSRGTQTKKPNPCQPIRDSAKTVVLGGKFRFLIMVAILLNTACLAVEHHNQPETWTSFLEFCNLAFTVFFTFEMVFKMFALGIYEYFLDSFNAFDAMVVLFSIIDAVQEGDGQGLSVLRTFRLLRILKLIRFFPSLRHQLGIMMETMDEVAVFMLLMALFTFVFSLMGMVLFGGKFCSLPDGSDCLCDDLANSTISCECSRSNFDTFFNASLTVFQILTTEDWNEVLYSAMLRTSKWSAIYFFILMTFGNYILLNLLVAIMVDGVQQQQAKEDIEKLEEEGGVEGNSGGGGGRKVSLEPLQMVEKDRTSIILPMILEQQTQEELQYNQHVSPKVSPHKSSDDQLEDLYFSAVAAPDYANEQDVLSLKSGSKWFDAHSRVVSFADNEWCKNNPDHHNPPPPENNNKPNGELLNRKYSGLLAIPDYDEIPRKSSNSSFAGMRGSDTDSKEMWKEIMQKPPAAQNGGTRIRTCSVGMDDGDRMTYAEYLSRYTWLPENQTENLPMSALKAMKHKGGDIFCCCDIKRVYEKSTLHEYDDRSFFIFKESNPVRKLCMWLVGQRWFDNLILILIFLNCITMAMERPSIESNSKERKFLTAANYFFTLIFFIEMLIKVIANGLFIGEKSYLQNGWNVLDGFLVVVGTITCVFSFLPNQQAPEIFRVLRVFRILRALRPLRVINRAPGLKLAVMSLMASFKDLLNVLLILLVFFVIFGILGVQLFKGIMYRCEGPDISDIRTKNECLALPNNEWVNARFNYDHLGQAMLSLFVMSTLDGWVVMMHEAVDAVGFDMQPQTNHNEMRVLYFVVFLWIVGFIVLNMFVGVLVENFQETSARLKEEARREKLERRASQIIKRDRKKSFLPITSRTRQDSEQGFLAEHRQKVKAFVSNKFFTIFILIAIILNVLSMALTHYNMPYWLEQALEISNIVFTIIFTVEAGLKIYAFTFCGYLEDNWNRIDLVVVIVSLIGVGVDLLLTGDGLIPINPSIVRILRVIRIFRGILLFMKLLRNTKGIRTLLGTVSKALPQVGNLGLLMFLLFFIYAALGVELFGRIECSIVHSCDGLSEHAHFKNFGMALLTLFRIATGDNWHGIMKDAFKGECDSAVDCKTNCCVSPFMSTIFFVSYILFAQFVLLNIVVAMLMKGFEDSDAEETQLDEANDEKIKEANTLRKKSLEAAKPSQSSDAQNQPGLPFNSIGLMNFQSVIHKAADESIC